MKSLKTMRSLLTGLLLICLGSVAFMGCSDNQSLANLIPSQLTGAIAPPKTPPPGATVLVTPTDAAGNPTGPAVATPVAAVSDGLKLESPSTTFTATSTLGQPGIVVEVLNAVGQVVGVTQTIPLAQVGTGLGTGTISIPVNPAGGSYRIALAPGTIINMGAAAGMTRQLPANLAIGTIDVLFDVQIVGGAVVSSTIPVDWKLNLAKSGADFKLADSTMEVVWNAALGSKVPTDGDAALTLTMRKGGVDAGTVSQTKAIVNNVAKFTGASQAPFNAVDIILDIRNSKPL